ncbi:AI-2E family transporter [Shimia sp. SDUM112013]|uniref:AI-2E family transporter n=1 Tax=Shimia sp. SDUM112013 TaxID=3136160 RepID=UPI0032EDF7F0
MGARQTEDDMTRDGYAKMTGISTAILATVAVGWVLNTAHAILVPIVWGALLAFLMDGISREMERLPVYTRIVPPWMRMTMTAIVLFLFLFLGVGFFARNMEPVVRAIPTYVDSLSVIVSEQAGRFDYEVELTWQSIDKLLDDNIDLQVALRYALNSLSYSAGYVALVCLYAILFLFERNAIKTKISAIVPDDEARAQVWQTIDMLISQIGTYFTMKTLINVVLGVICYLIFLVFGVEFAAFFAVLTAIFNYIPYVGSWIAMALPMLFAVGQFGLSSELLLLFASLSAAQFGIGYFWEPRLMGRSMNISPVVVMVSLAAWTAIWGGAGAILSVILTSAVVTIMALFPGSRPLAILLTNDGNLPEPYPASKVEETG